MALHGRAKFFGKMFGGIFYMGTNDQIIQGGNLMVKRFKGRIKLVFPLTDSDLVIDILFEILTPQTYTWALYSESEACWLKSSLPVTLGSNKYQTQ